MNSPKSQRGMSFIGVLVLAIIGGFLVMCALAIMPAYMEYFTVRDVLQNVAEDPKMKDASPAAVRRRISNVFGTNRIEALKASDVVLSRDKGEITVNGNYEARVHLVSNIDAVMVFDDLIYVIGKGD